MIAKLAVAAGVSLATALAGAGGTAVNHARFLGVPQGAGVHGSHPRDLADSGSSGGGDVDALSPTNAWTVGSQCVSGCGKDSEVDHTLIQHWDGSTWSVIASPSHAVGTSYLTAVSANSPTDIWAVGTWFHNGRTTTTGGTLILHWNGTAWSIVPSPSPGSAGTSQLDSVAAVSATDVWAVGDYVGNGPANQDTLILHWNGTTWSQVPSPSPGKGYDYLYGVSSDSPTTAWAAGVYVNAAGYDATLLLRWNGTTWSKVPSPDPGASGNYLYAVTAVSPTSAWAAGTSCPGSGCLGSPPLDTIILHWNGTAWSTVTTPDPGYTNSLSALTATSPANAWAVGGYEKTIGSAERTLILHWNGKAWSQVSSHQAGGGSGLDGVSADSSSDAWATGSSMLHWNGTAWSVG